MHLTSVSLPSDALEPASTVTVFVLVLLSPWSQLYVTVGLVTVVHSPWFTWSPVVFVSLFWQTTRTLKLNDDALSSKSVCSIVWVVFSWLASVPQ